MYIAISNRYLIADNFQKRAIDFNFPAEVWSVASALADLSKATTSSELENLTGLGSDQIRGALDRLLAEKLVREDLMSWKEFIAAKKSDSGAVRVTPAAPKPSANPAQPQPTAETAVRNGHLAAQGGVALRLGSIAPQKGVVTSGMAWIAQRADAAQVASFKSPGNGGNQSGDKSGGRLLRPMLEKIEKLKGGGVEGQLLVYQVFLRVPYELLSAEGIKSLHFVDDQTMIHNPALLQAIIKAAKDVIGIDLE